MSFSVILVDPSFLCQALGVQKGMNNRYDIAMTRAALIIQKSSYRFFFLHFSKARLLGINYYFILSISSENEYENVDPH